jgi:predicted transcriptional regulator
MSTWIPEVAQAFAEANHRAAAAVREEAAQFDRLRHLEPAAATLRLRAARAARAETLEVVAKADEAAELWEAVTWELRQRTPADQLLLLERLLSVIESGQAYLAAVRGGWSLVEQLGGAPESEDVLAKAAGRFEKMRRQVRLAIECRTVPWQPKDPERFERGLREAAEGKALTPDEVKARFRNRTG